MPKPDRITNDEWLALFEAGGEKRAHAVAVAKKIAKDDPDPEALARLDERVQRAFTAEPEASPRRVARALGVSYQAVYRSLKRACP